MSVTKNDENVLRAIFDPIGQGMVSNLADLDSSQDDIDMQQSDNIMDPLGEGELTAVQTAVAGDLNSSLNMLNHIIDQNPERASSYNNRAQVYRLLGNTQSALCDLDHAIRLSNGRGKTASQAFTQRGMIRRLNQQDELALADFKAAANLGNEFARTQVVAMNPYAAMCNKMLSEMFSKIQRGECEYD